MIPALQAGVAVLKPPGAGDEALPQGGVAQP